MYNIFVLELCYFCVGIKLHCSWDYTIVIVVDVRLNGGQEL